MQIKNIKYIYVLDDSGKPLMPTKRLGMVRRWLTSGQAHWYKNSRNTIQFDRPTEQHLQKVTQGCDLGDHLGISVITNKREVYSSESYCDGNQVHKRMQARKMYRSTRRNHLRHRAPRFRVYRANKIKKGRRVIRRRHYQLRPYDLVDYQNQIWQVKGVQNRGKYIKLTKKLVKDVVTNIKNVTILLHANGCLISLD